MSFTFHPSRRSFLALAVSGLLASLAHAQFQPPPVAPAAGGYEEPPLLVASEILLPEYLQGPNFKVREPVITYAGHNDFTIDSDFGIFEATGDEQLVERILEIAAIAPGLEDETPLAFADYGFI